uniref:(northern house mosquito) hypothetical protein n=1 Tax=Culex pipiens TaxID=7175 RepID=A0A8D8BI00_CULPI
MLRIILQRELGYAGMVATIFQGTSSRILFLGQPEDAPTAHPATRHTDSQILGENDARVHLLCSVLAGEKLRARPGHGRRPGSGAPYHHDKCGRGSATGGELPVVGFAGRCAARVVPLFGKFGSNQRQIRGR